MKSLRKVMSIALTVAMLFTLLVPATFVSAEVAPALSMSYVDASGNAVTALNPGTKAYLRVSVSGIEQVQTMGIKVDATGAEIDTNKANLVARHKDTAAFIGGGSEIMEINLSNGVEVTSSSIKIKLTDSMTNSTVNPPVVVSAFDLVDIPFTVTAAKDETVAFEFATGASDTYVQVGAAATTKWSIGHSSRPLTAPADNKISTTVTEIPYAIETVALDPAFAAIPLQAEGNGYEFPGFGDSKLKATYDLDRDADSAKDTFSYDIIDDLADAPADGAYAYVDISKLDVTAKADYELDVTVYDNSIKDTNGDAAGQFSGKVTVSVTDAAPTDKYKVEGTVEVKYGTDAEGVKAAVKVLSAETVIKTVYTDGSAKADTNAAAYDLANADIVVDGAYNGTVKGDYSVVTINDANVIEGTITVTVNPTTITAIELTPAWVAMPEGKEDDAFPGFTGYEIKAAYDAATSVIEYATYAIVTDAAADGVAYVDVETYNAAAKGDYTLPVVIKNASAISADYEGSIIVNVADAIATNEVVLNEDVFALARINRGVDDFAAAAEAKVNELIASGLFAYVLTNGEVGEAIAAEDIDSVEAGTITDTEVSVTVTFANDKYIGENNTTATVDVSLGDPGVISAAKFVQKDDADAYVEVTPAISAAIADYAEESELAMDWSAYTIAADFAYPDVDGSAEVDYYEYYTDGATKYFTVEGWVDFKDGAEIGDQTVTVKIYDASKANEEGLAYTAELKATITEADSANIVALTDATISVKNGTSEEDALAKLYEEEGLYVEIMKDGSTKDSDVKIKEATIADYDAVVKGEYEVTVVATDAEEGVEVLNDAVVIIKVKAKSSGGAKAGTVVGGGGKVGSSKVDTEDPADDKKDEEVTGTPIADDHWAKEIVDALAEAGIIDAKTETKESIEAELTREEAAKIVALALGLEMTGSVDAYTDAAEIADEYKAYVAAASAAGIFEGHDDGSFDPKGELTREQVAAVIIRAFGFGEGTGEVAFTDAALLGWSKGYVAKAAELGIVEGYEDNSFKPANSITRAEAFAIVNRAMALKNALEAAIAE